jgi:hypothetical protein
MSWGHGKIFIPLVDSSSIKIVNTGGIIIYFRELSGLVMSTFSFFVNETNSFFAFDHEKTNDSSFFTLTKQKY